MKIIPNNESHNADIIIPNNGSHNADNNFITKIMI